MVEKTYVAHLTVKRSRFYALLFPASSQDQVQAVLAQKRKELRKACHHCWAARWGDSSGPLTELAQNDGEVGRPGLKLLELLQRHDVLGAIVVSRIFGGVKLGPGGVGRAFQQVGLAALESFLPKSQ